MRLETLRVFLDRSIGTKKIAAALRELDVDVQTIQDRYRARCFTFPRGDLAAAEMIRRLTVHLPTIRDLARQNGPYVFHLGATEVSAMRLDCGDVPAGR
jgi:hypothetical protein